MSRVANARSYADADLEHDGGADHRRARRRSDERQYPRFADRRTWNTDPHPPRPPCRLPPAPRARILRSPKLQGKSGRPALGLSTSRLRTQASAGQPSQSSTGRDRWWGCPVRVEVAEFGHRLRMLRTWAGPAGRLLSRAEPEWGPRGRGGENAETTDPHLPVSGGFHRGRTPARPSR